MTSAADTFAAFVGVLAEVVEGRSHGSAASRLVGNDVAARLHLSRDAARRNVFEGLKTLREEWTP